MNKSLFSVSDDIKKKLDIHVKTKPTVRDKILRIFAEAEKMGKTELSIEEITAAYYNLYTATGQEGIKNKKVITLFLFTLKGGKEDNGVLQSAGRGKFKIRRD